MEYLVLAYKDKDKTYEMTESLSEAYEGADMFIANGYKIERIMSLEIKKDYIAAYEDVNEIIRRTCVKFKNQLDENDVKITKEKMEETVELIIALLSQQSELEVPEADDYIKGKIKENLGWNDITNIIESYVEKKLKERR